MLMLPFFFLVGGLAQLFWVIPTIRNWGRIWDYIGIVGTIAFIGIWAITIMPGNPITGRGGPINQTALIVEISQIIFVVYIFYIVPFYDNVSTLK